MGGKIHLDKNAAKKVIQTHIAAPLGLTIEDAALVAYRVAAAKMADTVRLVIAQQGLDPRRFSLVAAGGAFPLFAALIADELKLAEVLVPWQAPAFCAWGMLGAPRQVERIQTCMIPQNDWNCGHISAMIEDALGQGYRELEDMGILVGERESELAFEMKYTDQHHEISIAIEDSHQKSLSLEHVNRAFHRRHQELYGYAETDHAWEIVNLRVVCREKIKPLTLPPMLSYNGFQAHRQREVYLDSSGKCAVKVFDSESLPHTIHGPALFEMPYTTTYVPPGFQANRLSQEFMTLQPTENKENFDDI
jgi:N-methylhydantoinase A